LLYSKILKIVGPIVLFVLAGTIRVLVKHANFTNWQNLVFKITIFADGLCYFCIGA